MEAATKQPKADTNGQRRRQTAEGDDERPKTVTNNQCRRRTTKGDNEQRSSRERSKDSGDDRWCRQWRRPMVEAATTTNGGGNSDDQWWRQRRRPMVEAATTTDGGGNGGGAS
ncbi:hypothetical protein LR48_Vigan07g113200 [Vigna angularis]|uniref:Uncharacterized protein n=1 Tax=Phaseolus angularis TaxID=3914 RepID=A0A0L9UXD9_PHAAN|nr:hypothetical protein LR48_Vigan07g113200 [Vigna angularis]